MHVVLFVHSLASDWNHGNAHFLRGVARALVARGATVAAFEPVTAWSAVNLAAAHGPAALQTWRAAYPELTTHRYDPATLDLDAALDGADLVLVHEWNEPALVARLGRRRRQGGRFVLLFHDTHHRMLSDPDAMAAYELDGYDGVLAFGAVLAEMYRRRGWGRQAFVWHEAADVRHFKPLPDIATARDLVWIGNWGDAERTRELSEFLIKPVAALNLAARVHGVRYPEAAAARLRRAGIELAGYLPNVAVPAAFAAARATVHVPRRPYTRTLPGIPTIRMFEALACGIPLVSAPWDDVEDLFPTGGYLTAGNGAAMRRHLKFLLSDRAAASEIAAAGRACILARHTCAHRVDELLAIHDRLGAHRRAVPQPA
jgi:spore maturation protein CgeB